MQILSLIKSLRPLALVAPVLALCSCVAPYPQPQSYNNGGGGYNGPPSSGPSYNQPSYKTSNYRSSNDNGATVHCGIDYDHPPHRFHSKMHHEHYCPGGPHQH